MDSSTAQGVPELGAIARLLGGTARPPLAGTTDTAGIPDPPDVLQRRFNFFDYIANGQLNGVIPISSLQALAKKLLPSPDSFVINDPQHASANGYLVSPTHNQRNWADLQHILPTYAFISTRRTGPNNFRLWMYKPSPAQWHVGRNQLPSTVPPFYTLFETPTSTATTATTPAAPAAPTTTTPTTTPTTTNTNPVIVNTPTPTPPANSSSSIEQLISALRGVVNQSNSSVAAPSTPLPASSSNPTPIAGTTAATATPAATASATPAATPPTDATGTTTTTTPTTTPAVSATTTPAATTATPTTTTPATPTTTTPATPTTTDTTSTTTGTSTPAAAAATTTSPTTTTPSATTAVASAWTPAAQATTTAAPTAAQTAALVAARNKAKKNDTGWNWVTNKLFKPSTWF